MSQGSLDPIRAKLKVTRDRLRDARAQQGEITTQVMSLSAEISRLEKVIAIGGPRELSVSDHAIVRYAERALGLNTHEIVEFLGRQIGLQVDLLGDGSYPLSGFESIALVAVVKNRTVVTIKPA